MKLACGKTTFKMALLFLQQSAYSFHQYPKEYFCLLVMAVVWKYFLCLINVIVASQFSTLA
jgi:hypothetical protein